MGQPIIPFLFRGGPLDQEKRRILEGVLINAGMDISRIQELPEAIWRRQYHRQLSDQNVWDLYPKQLLKRIGSIFARVVPVIPFSSFIEASQLETVEFLGRRMSHIDGHPKTAKQIFFLEESQDFPKLIAKYPIGSRSNAYLRKGGAGLLVVIPLYDYREVKHAQGSIREFVHNTNSELESKYQSLGGEASRDHSPPPSRR